MCVCVCVCVCVCHNRCHGNAVNKVWDSWDLDDAYDVCLLLYIFMSLLKGKFTGIEHNQIRRNV
jgi:hypothetical protein